MKGRPLAELILTAEEKATLERFERRPKSSQRLVLRSRIVLACASGMSNREAAEHVGVCPVTVGKWRSRFVSDRLEGLADEPRPGVARTVTDEQVEAVIARTLETKPKGATHWSVRTMAKATGMPKSTVHRIWQTFGLKPHKSETFKLSTDPFFVEKVRDVVGLYMNPPEHALVLCVDEKSQVQALDRTQPVLPMDFGYPEYQTHDYVRHGTTSLFAALNAKTGDVIGQCHRRHRHQEFLKFLNRIDDSAPDGAEVHLIMDNYGTHKTEKVKKWFQRHPNYHVHFTPTSASWLNLVERFFSEITQKRIRRGTFTSVPALERAIHEYLNAHNEEPKPFVWTATAEAIFGKLNRFCERISGTGH